MDPNSIDAKRREQLLYRVRKWLLKNPDGNYYRYLNYTGDQSMTQAIFDLAAGESPEQRIMHLKTALFKPQGIGIGAEAPPPPKDIPLTPSAAAPEFGRRTIPGKIPPRLIPPTRPTLPRLIRGPRKPKEEKPEVPKETTDQIAEAPPAIPDSENQAVSPVPLQSGETDNMVTKKKPAAHKGKTPSPEMITIYERLKKQFITGHAVSTYTEYCKEHGKVKQTIYQTARQKLKTAVDRGDLKGGPLGRGKPDKVESGGEAGISTASQRVEILYTSDHLPSTDAVEELRRAILGSLTAFAASSKVEIDPNDFQFKLFSDGFEVRRVVK